MPKHQKRLTNYPDSFEQLATELGDLTYDSVAVFLKELSQKLNKDAMADKGRDREKLGNCLSNASQNLAEASKAIEQAWVICKPYMNDYEE